MKKSTRYLLLCILFFLSSCTTVSRENINSKEYGLILNKIVAALPEKSNTITSSYLSFYISPSGVFAHSFSDQEIFYEPHRQQLRKEGRTTDQNYYYNLEYLKPGKYSVVLVTLAANKSYDIKLKGCVDIKGGVINYLGDYYTKIGDSSYASFGNWFVGQETFDANVFVRANLNDAKKFMVQYYPEYKFPFVSSILSKENC